MKSLIIFGIKYNFFLFFVYKKNLILKTNNYLIIRVVRELLEITKTIVFILLIFRLLFIGILKRKLFFYKDINTTNTNQSGSFNFLRVSMFMKYFVCIINSTTTHNSHITQAVRVYLISSYLKKLK